MKNRTVLPMGARPICIPTAPAIIHLAVAVAPLAFGELSPIVSGVPQILTLLSQHSAGFSMVFLVSCLSWRRLRSPRALPSLPTALELFISYQLRLSCQAALLALSVVGSPARTSFHEVTDRMPYGRHHRILILSKDMPSYRTDEVRLVSEGLRQ